MSNFVCEKCGTICYDSPNGYVTGCIHYPADIRKKSMYVIGFIATNNISNEMGRTFVVDTLNESNLKAVVEVLIKEANDEPELLDDIIHDLLSGNTYYDREGLYFAAELERLGIS